MCNIPLVTCHMLHVIWHYYFQTFRAGDLTFLANVHHPMSVMCPISHFICHVSCVRYHKEKIGNLAGLVSGGSVISRATPI